MATMCSHEGLAEIAGHEGIVTSPYYDSQHVLTVFIGHTKNGGQPDPASFPMGVAQPVARALQVFGQDITRTEKRVEKAFTRPLEPHQFDAACSFDLNTGAIDRATWVKKWNAGDDAGVRKSFMDWRKPPEIIPRRKKECALFFDGTYANGGMATVYPADAKGRVQWSKRKSVNVLKLLTGTSDAIPSPSPQPVDPVPSAGSDPRPAPPVPALRPSSRKTAGIGGVLVLAVAALVTWWHEVIAFLSHIFGG